MVGKAVLPGGGGTRPFQTKSAGGGGGAFALANGLGITTSQPDAVVGSTPHAGVGIAAQASTAIASKVFLVAGCMATKMKEEKATTQRSRDRRAYSAEISTDM
jgi:hypothetical protein